MSQIYHANAKTNVHCRSEIHKSKLTNKALSITYNISQTTVSKWKNRDCFEDKSSHPKTIKYALSTLEKGLALSIRKASWLPLDEVHEMLLPFNSSITRSAVYRFFCAENVNKVPATQKEKAKKFKEYDPGYLHIDVTYLPKLEGKKYYLFVAIDRATRLIYYEVYDAKTAENAEKFMQQCIHFFSFEITHVLTDNGLEFTNKLIKSKKGALCQKDSKLDKVCKKNNIKHRLTKPSTPKTNGMVERANGTIKNSTILKTEYENKKQMNTDLINFLVHYNLHRRHGSLRKELNVKTPLEALQKWYELKPEIFKESPNDFKQKLLSSKSQPSSANQQQPCET